MARRSLKPQLNQIRAWVRQGRTDAWIAHQLEVSTSELREFRRRHELDAEEEADEVDLRDEELAAEAAQAEEDEGSDQPEEASEDRASDAADGDAAERPRRRRRRRRG